MQRSFNFCYQNEEKKTFKCVFVRSVLSHSVRCSGYNYLIVVCNNYFIDHIWHLTIKCCLVQGHHFPSQPGFPPGSSEHGQFSSSTAVHESFAVTQAQHHTSYAPAVSVPISFAGTTQIRGNNKTLSLKCFLLHQ